jgi:hypothetical protein
MRVIFRGIFVAAAVCAIAAALYHRQHAVHAYSPPVPRDTRLRPISLILSIHENPMDEAWAPILGGILPADKGAQWSWTNAQPRVRFRLEETDRWLFCLHFAAAGQVLQAVGPQTVRIALNGTPLGAVNANEAREYDVRLPVDARSLKLGGMNDVELSISPVFVADDGVALGVLLHSVGFVENR